MNNIPSHHELAIFEYAPLANRPEICSFGHAAYEHNAMPSLIPGFEYDIFVSYRQKDNMPSAGYGKADEGRWVSEFVGALKKELNSILKEDVSVYFDENPHDGLLETHHVGKSLEGKLKCLIFVPVLSHTYCDPRSFAWTNEFLVFCRQAKGDAFGLDIKLHNRNVASRILPIQIHELDLADQQLFEKETGSPLRSIDFIFTSPGVNRPLTPYDERVDNLRKIFYRDQINKTANAIADIIKVMTVEEQSQPAEGKRSVTGTKAEPAVVTLWSELIRRNVFRAAFTYLVVALLLYQVGLYLTPILKIEERILDAIFTVMLLGLPAAMVMAWYYELSPYGVIRTDSALSRENPFSPGKKKPLTGRPMVTALVGLLVLQMIYFNYVRPKPVSPVTDALGNRIISIAVLPFESRSTESGDKYIAEGLTDDIINRLTIVGQLRVTNRGKVKNYQGNALAFDKVAGELDVMTILTGSVQRIGKEVVIRAQLIDGKTGSFIWGNTFYRTMQSIVTLQTELSRVVVDQLKLKLSGLEKSRLDLVATENATAYDYYLRGRSHYYKYEPAANDSAIMEFKKAIELDPSYARAWAGLGDAYSQLNMRFGRGVNWLDSSTFAGKRAIQLDSNLSEAYKAYANVYSYRKQYTKAFPLLKKSVELNPTNEQAVGNLGTNYLLRNDLPNALRWEKKAVGMNPKNWIPYQIIGWTYRLLGDLSQAESWLSKSIELSPKEWDSYELLAYTYLGQGRRDAAIKLVPRVLETGREDSRALEKAGLISHYAGDKATAKVFYRAAIDKNPSYKDDPNTLASLGLGQILLEEGKRVEADVYLTHFMGMMQQELANESESFEPRLFIAAVHAIRGNRDQSLQWLQKAMDAGWMDHLQVTHGPFFEKYRTDPAFLEKVGIVKRKAEMMLKEASKD